MKLPKGKLLTLLAIFAAVGLVTATGAFTTVTAQRTASVSVSGDSSALLAMGPYDGPNGDGDGNGGMATSNDATSSSGYAKITSGTLEINIAGFNQNNPLGSGVNKDAVTDIQNVFVIQNQGTQTVNVSITDTGNNSNTVTFYNSSVTHLNADNGGLENTNVTLGPGDMVVVSMEIDTTSADLTKNEELIDGIEVSANATTATPTFSG